MKLICHTLLAGLLLSSCANTSRQPQQVGQIETHKSFTVSNTCYEGIDESGKACSLNVMALENDGYLASARTTSCGDSSQLPIAQGSRVDITDATENTTTYKSVTGSKDTRADLKITSVNHIPTSFKAAYWPTTFNGYTLKSPAAKVACNNLKAVQNNTSGHQ